ncbi:MAG: aspartokinase [Bacillota bacterium]|jgi:aspartate kinase
MKIVVQKFGGTSLSTNCRRLAACRQIIGVLELGYAPVVVVSAMGRLNDPYATDTLLSLVEDGKYLAAPEQALLLSCGEIISASILSNLLGKLEVQNRVLTGAQAGIITSSDHTKAIIHDVNPTKIIAELRRGKVVVIPGFQGQTKEGDVTTLGRGGSDTTAVALGAALNAESVDIFTDVNGIMTADPAVVKEATILRNVTFDEAFELAAQGAKVIHPHAVSRAMEDQLPVRIKAYNSSSLFSGTLISDKPTKQRLITGIAHLSNIAQIKIKIVDQGTEIYGKVFQAMASAGLNVDFISVSPAEITYTILDKLVPRAIDILMKLDLEPECIKDCAKLSIVGSGITGVPGVMAKIVTALMDQDIPILQSADSYTTIWVLVPGKKMSTALTALHQAFLLGK